MSTSELIGAIVLVAMALGVGIAIGRAHRTSTSGVATQSAAMAPQQASDTSDPTSPLHAEEPTALDSRLLALLQALPGIVIVVDSKGSVLLASQEATREHLVRRNGLTNDDLAAAAASSLTRNETIVLEVTVLRPPLRRGRLDLRVSAIPIGVSADLNRLTSGPTALNAKPSGLDANRHEGQVAVLLLEDLTAENRVRVARRDFIANVSHELKTPVGAMSLLAEALVAASDDKDSVEHFASRLQTEAIRLTSLINDVIDLSRMQGDDPLPNPRPVDVRSLVEKTVASVASACAAKDIEIVISSPYRYTVIGDSDQLLIALTNLLTNAIAYSEPGTHIAIVVRQDSGLVEIDVKDQGIGIPEEELEHIFDRFFRVDEARSRFTGGTGLGLAIVRNVCRNHGGDVSVWSVQGEGSTFTMKLPSDESESETTTPGLAAELQAQESAAAKVSANPQGNAADSPEKLGRYEDKAGTQPLPKIETAGRSTTSKERT